ncbi:MAG: TonB-dependent receptor domain-containing protein, partial [Gammaproteobacteria bacterium]
LQFDVFAQDVRSTARERQSLAVLGANFGIGAPVNKEEHAANLNPRVGLRWDLGDTQQLRLVAQRWRRPSSFGSLAPVDTLGVPLNDSLPAFGGKYERVRLQYDGEFDARWFLRAFLDREVVDNGLAGERSPSFSNMVDSLTALRARQQFFTAEPQIEQTPIFPDGSVSSAGLDLNLLLSAKQTLSARYVYRYGDNNSDNPAFDGEIPYIPHHYAEFGSQWTLPGRWLLRADAVYHSRRFQNDPGQAPAEAGWYFRLKSYWETADKHHSVQLVLDNLFLDGDTMIHEKRDQYINLQYSYRL